MKNKIKTAMSGIGFMVMMFAIAGADSSLSFAGIGCLIGSALMLIGSIGMNEDGEYEEGYPEDCGLDRRDNVVDLVRYRNRKR